MKTRVLAFGILILVTLFAFHVYRNPYVGDWAGYYVQSESQFYKWEIRRDISGEFEMQFIQYVNGTVFSRYLERGTWNHEAGIYSNDIKSITINRNEGVKEKSVNLQESYRTNSMNLFEHRFESVSSEYQFSEKRKWRVSTIISFF